MAGVSPTVDLQRKQPFSAGNGTDGPTAATNTALIPAKTYVNADRPTRNTVAVLTAYTLWNVDDESAISSEFDWANLRNYGGADLLYEVTVDGGTATEVIRKSRIMASCEHIIDGQQANSTEAAGAFGTITGRVTEIRVYNPSATQIGKVEMFMYAEPE